MKIVISSLVGAIIIFAWQSISWMILPVHKNSLLDTPQEDQILEVLNDSGLSDGVYYVPYLNPDEASQEEMQTFREELEGKSVAMITYKSSYSSNMGKSLLTGFLLLLLSSYIISYAQQIGRPKLTNFFRRWLFSLDLGILVACMGILMSWNWWQTPMHFVIPELVDLAAGFGISGLWYAWYWGRE